MRERGSGRIINIASTAGKMGSLNQSTCNVSKHAVVGLTRCVAMEFAKTGVTVNAICPGPVRTRMLNGLWESQAKVRGVPIDAVKAGMIGRVPLGRFIEPDDALSQSPAISSSRGSWQSASFDFSSKPMPTPTDRLCCDRPRCGPVFFSVRVPRCAAAS